MVIRKKFFSGYGIIGDHWVKENRLSRNQTLTLDDLYPRLEMKKGYEGEQDVSFDSKFML